MSTPSVVPQLPPPGEDSRQGAALTAERLLEAAHELLYERAGGTVSVSDLCARAGANVAMVKYCFGNKDGLFDALVERVVASFVADLERLDGQDVDPDEKLRLHIRGVVRNYARYPYLNRLLSERFAADQPGVVTRLSELFAQPTREWYAGLLREGRAAGTFREIDPTFFFFSVLGAAEFMFAARPWMERAFDQPIGEELLQRFTDHTTTLILAGIAEPPQRT